MTAENSLEENRTNTNTQTRSSARRRLLIFCIKIPSVLQSYDSRYRRVLIALSQKQNNTDFGQMSQIHSKRCSSCLNMTGLIFVFLFLSKNDLNRSHMDVGEVLQMNNSSRASTTELQLGPARHLLCPVGKSIEGLPWN